MKSITYIDGTKLIIEDKVLNKLYQFCQTFNRDEAGGILFGKQICNEETYILCDLSVPNIKDKHGKSYFIRNKESAQMKIIKIWKETEGVINYLGEWHTHSITNPFPSSTDKNLVKQIINDRSNVFIKIFLIIVGYDKSLYIGLANSLIGSAIIDYKIILGE